MPKPKEIKSAIQLIVEGNDQRNFFEAFTSHLSITNVQIQDFGGVSQLRDFLEGLVSATGFQTVQSIGNRSRCGNVCRRSVPKRSFCTGECRTAYAGQPRRTY